MTGKMFTGVQMEWLHRVIGGLIDNEKRDSDHLNEKAREKEQRLHVSSKDSEKPLIRNRYPKYRESLM